MSTLTPSGPAVASGPTETILLADGILTMNPEQPDADAVLVVDGRVAAVGTQEECLAVAPRAVVLRLEATTLLPGFIDAHSHPALSGRSIMPPAHYIAPWVCPTWANVEKVMLDAAGGDASGALVFFGFDELLHQHEPLVADDLDRMFGDRPVAVIGNSGHTATVTTAVLDALGWSMTAPANPIGGSYGRRVDGGLDGTARETPAVFTLIGPVLAGLNSDPVQPAAEYFALMARSGITSTSDMAYSPTLLATYEALAERPHCPLRISLYQMSTVPGWDKPFTSSARADMLRMRGVKMWADGSPWVGNIATAHDYLDSAATRAAAITPGAPGFAPMNYSREQLLTILTNAAIADLPVAVHVNGELGLDVVLDAFETVLTGNGLLGSDHRWRIEHVGTASREQLLRAGGLGVVASMAPFQLYYWGDLLDGQMFDSAVGASWQPFRLAFDAGLRPSFHNDGSVTPPNPLLNIQTAVTRSTASGTIHGPDMACTLDEALQAETVNAAFALGLENEVGRIAVGMRADFVELSADPRSVAPDRISTITVQGTWLDGQRVDLEQFVND